ncbi:hypothetical protein B0181_07945 [Moraxella caviae]|uniref:Uncharacterized protein n=1 Tax=Moraxella caviae TaxID=34060 RepID=A0A1S9ZZ17_9GAMM|nr:type IV secretory system conjugative DNA transfer family protein [Moraxella caviae]OOR88639.1 hypothetical protein B0181_07945 [Moraxella caviae]STZ13677.1 Uncharacterised protein [Moraxella caviae]
MKPVKIFTTLSLCLGAIFATGASANWHFDSGNQTHFSSAEDFLKAQSKIHRIAKSAEDMQQSVHLKAIEDYAKGVAMQASIRSNMRQINNLIAANARNLDAIYDFTPLMIQGRVVPPVVTEATGLYNQNGRMQVRLTDRVYEIAKQAHISSTAPNWRDYLQFSNEADAYHDYIYLTAGLKPNGILERNVWEKATKEGWQLGQKQANTILLEAMDRLNRDYIGMVRFHQLAAKGKLDMPALSSYKLSDNTDGIRMLMGEELLQITSLPEFKVEPTGVRKGSRYDLDTQGPLQNLTLMEHDTALEKENDQPVIEQTNKAVNEQPVVETPPQYTIVDQYETREEGQYLVSTIRTTVIGTKQDVVEEMPNHDQSVSDGVTQNDVQ